MSLPVNILKTYLIWSVHVNLLQSWGSLWCGDSFASVYMRTPTARVTVKRYHGYGSRCPTHLCTLVPDDEGEYKLYQLLSVHACSGDGRKSYQTLKSKNIIIKSHLYLNVKRTHRKTYKQVLTDATTLPYHYVPVILISSDWSLLVWSGGDDRNWHCAGICAVCDPHGSGLSAGLQWWRARWRYVINYWADGCSIYICKTSYRFLHFKYLFYEYQTLTISIKIYYFNIPAFPVLIHTTVQRNMVNNDLDRKVLVIQSLYILAILIGNWINSIPNLIYDESLSNGSTVSCEFVNKQWSQLMIVSAPPSTPSPYQLIYPDQMQLQVFTPNQASVYPGKINILFHSIV